MLYAQKPAEAGFCAYWPQTEEESTSKCFRWCPDPALSMDIIGPDIFYLGKPS